MKYLGISKEQAEKEIETEDSKRYEFHKYYTNEIWGMSNGYELCLDEGILGIDGCVKMILDYLKIRKFNFKKFLMFLLILCMLVLFGIILLKTY